MKKIVKLKQFKWFLHGGWCGNQISVWGVQKSDFFSVVLWRILKMYGNLSMTSLLVTHTGIAFLQLFLKLGLLYPEILKKYQIRPIQSEFLNSNIICDFCFLGFWMFTINFCMGWCNTFWNDLFNSRFHSSYCNCIEISLQKYGKIYEKLIL